MIVRRITLAGVLLTLALSVPLSLAAQDQPKPQWSVVTMTTIKPDARAEYEAWQKQITAAYKKAEVPSRTVVQTIMGDLFEYISLAPITKFADLDGATPVERALGKESAAALLAQGRGVYRFGPPFHEPRHSRTEYQDSRIRAVTPCHG